MVRVLQIKFQARVEGLYGSLPALGLHSLTKESNHQEEMLERSTCSICHTIPPTPSLIINAKFYITFCYD